jgi:hypothetical protein
MVPRIPFLAASFLAVSAAALAVPAVAQTHKPVAKPAASKPPAESKGPKSIGKFDDWTAATFQEAGQTVCYAFTRAQSSSPTLAGRGAVILTVTERQSRRDDVAMEAGFTFTPDARVTVQVDQTGLDFYTNQRNAFAKDGKAAVAAFQRGSRAIARSPGVKDAPVTDTFSLKGFGASYSAITKACPSK